MKLHLLILIYTACVIAGCSRHAGQDAVVLSEEGKEAYRQIALLKGFSTNDYTICNSSGTSLKASIGKVTNAAERVRLMNSLE